MRAFCRVAAAVLVVLAIRASAPAQTSTPAKRIVRIGITDAKGHPVEIKDSDVQLLVDEKPIPFNRIQPTSGKYIVLVDVSGSNRMKAPFISQSVRKIFDLLSQGGAAVYLGLFSDKLALGKSPMDAKAAGETIDGASYKGGTMLYDALSDTSLILDRVTQTDSRAGILVITDGEDNESSHTLEQTLKALQETSIPVYAIDLFLGQDRESVRGRNSLRSITSHSGGGIIALDAPRDFSKELGELLDSQQVFQIDEPSSDVDFAVKTDPKFRVSAPQKLRIIPHPPKK